MVNIAQGLATLERLAKSAPVDTLATAFEAAGKEFALVGGPVRDAFLGKNVSDLDFTTNATPDEIIDIIRPLTKVWWDIGRDFGTIGAKIDRHTVEITTYRSDSYQPDSRKPEVVYGETIEEDLKRRDFTVNALALRLPSMQLVDSGTGIEDLQARILRTPIAPEISFSDDPLRMLRAARFMSQLDFDLEKNTARAAEDMASRLKVISAERIRDEFSKLLLLDNPVPGLKMLTDSGLADHFIPELPALRLEQDEHGRHKDVYQHSLQVLLQAIELEKSREFPNRPDLILRLAALLHDIGKPRTRKIEPSGRVTFYHHDVVGAKMARKRLQALRFDKSQISAISHLIFLHLRFFGYSEGAWTDSAVRRYVRDAGDELERLHILTRSDVTSQNQNKVRRLARAYDDLEQRINELEEQEELSALRPQLDGNEIMELLDLPPGPQVGKAYAFLLELRLEEGVLEREEVIQRLNQWWSEQKN